MNTFLLLLVIFQLYHYASSSTILQYIREGTGLYNTTKNIFKGFTRNQDLTSLSICHVLPPPKIYQTLGSIFMNPDNSIKGIEALDLDRLRDFKRDLFKVHTDSAFLKEVEMQTKARFYGLNANMQDQVELIIDSFTEIQKQQPKRVMMSHLVDDEVRRRGFNLSVSGKTKQKHRNATQYGSVLHSRNTTYVENETHSGNVNKGSAVRKTINVTVVSNEIENKNRNATQHGSTLHSRNTTNVENAMHSGNVNKGSAVRKTINVTVVSNENENKNSQKYTKNDPNYMRNITAITSLFYNAPANLRVTNNNCINDNDEFEDPSLIEYGDFTDKKDMFTEHSRYLAKKYSLFILKDDSGQIKTTDTRKAFRKHDILDKDKVVESNVFDMFFKDTETKGLRKSKQIN